MRLLLTSNGLSNDSIANALEDLIGKKPTDVKIAFIPTAAYPEQGDKQWLTNDVYRIRQRGYDVDIIDLPAFTPDSLKFALEEADVIFVGGGNSFYLSYWMQKSGMFDMLSDLLTSRVYAGISAGSMIAGQSLILASQAVENPLAFKNKDYDEIGPVGESSGTTLQLANLVLRPHLNSRLFSSVRIDILQDKVKDVQWPVYAIDDDSALKIIDGVVEVISEGEWKLLNASAQQ